VTSRALAVAAACLLGLYGRAAADTLELNVRELGSSDAPYKVRLSAALSLSKSHDARAVIALADALVRDDEPTIRRVSALALEKLVDSHIADDARELALDALDKAAATDGDQRVRDTAARIAKELSGLRRRKDNATSDKPPVFINIGTTQDQSKKLPNDAADRLTKVVKKNVERTGYATTWPGGLPTSAELGKSRAFIVASTVKMVEITKAGRKTEIACTVEIRVATWGGKDGGERWEANRAASASGSAKATTGNADRDVAGGVRDCVEAVAEDITARQVVPFLRRLATM
jgi:hypothetical protein